MSPDEQRRAANKDILDVHEALLKSAIALREMAMNERDKCPKASTEWGRLNDLVIDADRQVLEAQEHLSHARAGIASDKQ